MEIKKETDKITSVHLEEGDLPEKYKTHTYERDTPHKDPVQGKVDINLSSAIEEILGPNGRMISHSKSMYMQKYRDHDVYFNACIFDTEGTQIWFGDLDLTLDMHLLRKAVKEVGTIIVTPESPFRFDGLEEGREYLKHTGEADRIVEIHP